jgi:signal transduction histidine kinase/CheY-like chemotaxis protein
MKHKLCFNVCLSLFLSMVVVIFLNYTFGFSQIMYLQWIVWGIFGALAFLFKYHKISRVAATVTLLTTGAIFLSTVLSLTNTIQSPIMPWFCIIPLYAFWLLNGRHARFWLLISAAVFLFFLYLFFSGYKPASVYDYYAGNNGYYAVIGLLLLLVNVYLIGRDFEKTKKHAIDEINQTNQELNEAMASLQKAKEELEEAQKHKDVFIAQMSHEMRTPMNAICGVAELLSNKPGTLEKELVSILSRSSKQLLNIITDILDISKLQTGKFQMQHVTYLLDELIQDIYSYTKKNCDEKGLALQFSIHHVDNLRLYGDPYRLSQILHNVLSNAVKFTEKGYIGFDVAFNAAAKQLHFTITDTGIGMTDGELKKIFTPFSQANKSIHLRFGGTGIGLNLSKQLIDLFGGTIQIKSEAGFGSQVFITYPVELATEADASLLPEKTIISADMKKRIANLNILLAEDNEVNRIIFTQLLKSEIPDIHIDTANNGEEALHKLEAHPYDLIVMDIQMPKCDGLQATRLIRSHAVEKLRTVPIIALSAYARKAEVEECITAGMNDYLSKPIDKNELLQKVYHLACENV